jgi:peptidyl-tRNA hydrolase
LYLITRRDLTPGFQACQASHAAFQFAVMHPDVVRTWHTDSNFLVILTVEDEDALLGLADEASERGLTYTVFVEPDLNVPHGEYTAMALEPSPDAEKLVANLPLALREESFV